MNFRANTPTDCGQPKGFVKDASTKKYEWKEWGKYPTTDLQCDHLVELQLTAKALVAHGFCQAWEGMLQQAHTHLATVPDVTNIFKPLKDAANARAGRFYLDGTLNGDKRAFVASVAKAGRAVTQHNAGLVDYIEGAKSQGNSVAAGIDSMATQVLNALEKELLDSHMKPGATEDDEEIYSCDVAVAKNEYKGGSPVKTYWGYVVSSV